ncbi:MAG: YihY/virulence factor BrkB family protein [Thermoleophilia bacterium]|nr:YihY/virulence factor BrkB family protein [Thermoleophilia bacterium]
MPPAEDQPAPPGGRSIPRLDAFQRRHPVLGFPIAVIYKYVDDSGAYLAALITYYGFLSLFPLLLILSTVLSVVLQNNDGLRADILDTAIAQFPLIADQLGDPKQLSGGGIGLAIGILGSLYGGIGVAQAVQHAMNTTWSVPRNNRPNPFKARARSLLLLFTAGIAVFAVAGVSIVAGSGSLGGTATKWLVSLGATGVSAIVFTVVFRLATARRLTRRQVVPGAIIAAVAWHLLQLFGIVYVNHVVRSASTTNSVFAVVLGLIAFIYVASVILVISVEINVVRVDRLHPRSLLTPFTDNVVLTDGDRRAYTAKATEQRNKGFQRISVRFDRDDDDETADVE